MGRKAKVDSSGASKGNGNGTANLGFEQKLWLAADKLRGTMDAAEYKHTVLGLIFLKYISDSFESRRQWLVRETADPDSDYFTKNEAQRSKIAEDRDEYLAENVFWVPPKARWIELQNNAKQPTIGKLIDDAMDAIERENPSLKGILPKTYARPDLDKTRLGELIDLIGTIAVGDEKSRSQDVLGRVYEYFLGKFASAEGKGGGEFYTPSCVVRVLVEMIEPFKGRVYDPCCGSGGMFVQSEKFVEAHGGKRSDIAVYGQESNPTTWRLAKMNLAIRGIESHLGDQWADTFAVDKHPDLKADFILANPPFNISDWGGERLKEDKRWVYGVPPAGNANFGWVQHMIHHLAPNGIAGFVLANIALSSDTGGENDIRRRIIESDLVDCIVSLPEKLFYSTPIPVSLWFLNRNKRRSSERDREGQTLFIDASTNGQAESRTHSVLTDETVGKIVATYHTWKNKNGDYQDIDGFCTVASLADISNQKFSLMPATYVGTRSKLSHITNHHFASLLSEAERTLEYQAQQIARLHDSLSHCLNILKQSSRLEQGFALNTWRLSEILTPSEERLGDAKEPEILTCTECGGLIYQKERFAKRVATEDTSSYRIVRKTDIVYNPYLLWKGAIDQCWITDIGITSPAYVVLKIKPGFDPSLIGFLLTAPWMIERYNGISVGTIQRRRRAPVEKFLELEVSLPSIEDQEDLQKITDVLQGLMGVYHSSRGSMRTLVKQLYSFVLSGKQS